jgi:hypothetical protein
MSGAVVPLAICRSACGSSWDLAGMQELQQQDHLRNLLSCGC